MLLWTRGTLFGTSGIIWLIKVGLATVCVSFLSLCTNGIKHNTGITNPSTSDGKRQATPEHFHWRCEDVSCDITGGFQLKAPLLSIMSTQDSGRVKLWAPRRRQQLAAFDLFFSFSSKRRPVPPWCTQSAPAPRKRSSEGEIRVKTTCGCQREEQKELWTGNFVFKNWKY